MKIIVKSPVEHNGQLYNKGEEIPGLTEKQIADLLAAGAIEAPGADIKPSKPEEAPDKSLGTADDAQAETKGVDEVANLPISMNMSKEKLIGIARANGLKLDKTTTRDEAYAAIKEYRKANKIDVKAEAENADNGESAPHGADSAPAGEAPVPANADEHAPAENTTDTAKEPMPAAKTSKKSK